MRHSALIFSFALIAAAALSGCNETKDASGAAAGKASGGFLGGLFNNRAADLRLPSGTSIDVTLASSLSSESANVGSSWNGTVRNSVVVDGRNVIPAGSPVSGTVSGVTPAHKGDRAMLDLRMTSISVGSNNYRIAGSTESIVAGSTRARNLGAIGAATVAGAVIGQQVGGSKKGTIIGGLIGGGAATAAVSQSKGYQVVLKQGTPLTFTTNDAVAVRP